MVTATRAFAVSLRRVLLVDVHDIGTVTNERRHLLDGDRLLVECWSWSNTGSRRDSRNWSRPSTVFLDHFCLQ